MKTICAEKIKERRTLSDRETHYNQGQLHITKQKNLLMDKNQTCDVTDIQQLKERFHDLELENLQLKQQLTEKEANIPEVSVLKASTVCDATHSTVKKEGIVSDELSVLKTNTVSDATNSNEKKEGVVSNSEKQLRQIQALLYENKSLKTNMYWLTTELKTIKSKEGMTMQRRMRQDSGGLEEGRACAQSASEDPRRDMCKCMKNILSYVKRLEQTVVTLKGALNKNNIIINDMLLKKYGHIPKVIRSNDALGVSKLIESYVTINGNDEHHIPPEMVNSSDGQDEETYNSASVIVSLDELTSDEDFALGDHDEHFTMEEDNDEHYDEHYDEHFTVEGDKNEHFTVEELHDENFTVEEDNEEQFTVDGLHNGNITVDGPHNGNITVDGLHNENIIVEGLHDEHFAMEGLDNEHVCEKHTVLDSTYPKQKSSEFNLILNSKLPNGESTDKSTSSPAIEVSNMSNSQSNDQKKDPLNESFGDTFLRNINCPCTLPNSLIHNLERHQTKTYLTTKKSNEGVKVSNLDKPIRSPVESPLGSPHNPHNVIVMFDKKVNRQTCPLNT